MSMTPMPLWLKLSSDATYYHRAGLTGRGIGPMKEAIDLIRQEPRLADELAVKLNYVANMLLAVGQLTEAEAAVREAMQIEQERGKPASDSNLMTLAMILHQQGRCDEAVRLGKQALAILRTYHGWLSDYYRQSKRMVASFKKPPIPKPAPAEPAGRGAA
jgi:tetratricopeptide (TPR) repeat protein